MCEDGSNPGFKLLNYYIQSLEVLTCITSTLRDGITLRELCTWYEKRGDCRTFSLRINPIRITWATREASPRFPSVIFT